METLLNKPLKKVCIAFDDRNFYLSQGKTEDYYCEDRKTYIYRAVISIVYKGKITRFFFHGSINDYQNGKMYYNESEFPFLLYCFLSDAHSGDSTFEWFCDEFGYDIDSRSAEKMYKACVRAAKKAYRLGIEEENQMCDLLNELNEKYDC